MHIVKEHERILNAVEKKDGILAGSLMQAHLKNSQSVLFEKQAK
jgi:DNA-binding FadR family transcriptional regulator